MYARYINRWTGGVEWEITRGCGLGPKIWRLIQSFWYEQVVVPKDGRYYGRPFRMERGVTEGDPVYPTIFNIIAGAVIREVLLDVYVPQKAQHGLVWAVG